MPLAVAAALLAVSLACQALVPGGASAGRSVPTASPPPSLTPAARATAPQAPTTVLTPLSPPGTALPTAGPTLAPATLVPAVVPAGNYTVQSGDTLAALALRFRTEAALIQQRNPGLDPIHTLPPGLSLDLPEAGISPNGFALSLLPDSEVVRSPSNQDFDVRAFVLAQPGYLATYSEALEDGQAPKAGWEIVALYARRYSLNPRLLLALLEYQTQALSRPAADAYVPEHALGLDAPSLKPGLSHQLGWAGNQLNYGYYGWRAGTVLGFALADGAWRSADPRLNAGGFAVARLLGLLYKTGDFARATAPDGLPAAYRRLFGEPASHAYEPLIPGGLMQPELQLPFEPGKQWAFTGGPHSSYGLTLPWGALDFAPPAEYPGCVPSPEWVVAVGDGRVSYAEDGLLELDLGGGWTFVYLHMTAADLASAGSVVRAGQRLGHPGCEGGRATADHLHLSRRFNGEWLAADGPVPFVLSGWVAHSEGHSYLGTLVHGEDGRVVAACSCAKAETRLWIEP